MDQQPCNICSFQCDNSTLWAVQNRWFGEHSSLAGAVVVPHHQSNPQSAQTPVNSQRSDVVAEVKVNENSFCRMGSCLFWHTDLKQVRRHRDDHMKDQHGFLCPNKTDTCSCYGTSFSRKDSVKNHCKRSRVCGDALAANGCRVESWGTFATEYHLVAYDLSFHKPYQKFYGRSRQEIPQ